MFAYKLNRDVVLSFQPSAPGSIKLTVILCGVSLCLLGQQFLSAFICSVWLGLMKTEMLSLYVTAQTLSGNRKLHFYVSAEDSMEQFAPGAVRGLTPVQVWRTRPISAKDIQLLKTSCVYYLEKGGGEQVQVHFSQRGRCLWKYLVLPGDRNAACVEFGVEIFVRLIQGDSSQRGKLINVQNISAIYVPGLHK